jgi:outer membrane protein TolC
MRVFSGLSACAFLCMLCGTAHAYSGEAVKDAERFLESVTTRFSAGTASSTDVAQAKYYLFDMKFKAKQISRARYCTDATSPLQEILTRAIDEAIVGRNTTSDVLAAKRQFYKLKALCTKS